MITHPYRGSKYGIPFCTECGVRSQRFAPSGVPMLWCRKCAQAYEQVLSDSLTDALSRKRQGTESSEPMPLDPTLEAG